MGGRLRREWFTFTTLGGGVFRAEGTGAERGANWCTEGEGQAGRLAFRGELKLGIL